jgi:D-aminopeptidase
MTGVHWIDEAGAFSGPVAITNTLSVGIAHHAILRWLVRHSSFNSAANLWMLPVAAETCDEYLNDINGQHVSEQHVLAACDNASAGAVARTAMAAMRQWNGNGVRSFHITLLI